MHLSIYSDGSADSRTGIGFGACLVISDPTIAIEQIKTSVRTKRFAQTSSTRLELQTLLWALDEAMLAANGSKLVLSIYTDSQNIISLPNRRAYLEKTDFVSSNNKRLKNESLYRQFFQLISTVEVELIKITGHQSANNKNHNDIIFSLVDKAARRALRENNSSRL